MKRKLKKIIALVLVLTFIVSLSACKVENEKTTTVNAGTATSEKNTTKVATVPGETTTGISDVLQKAINDPEIQPFIKYFKENLSYSNNSSKAVEIFNELIQKLVDKTGLSVEVIKGHLSEIFNSAPFNLYIPTTKSPTTQSFTNLK